MKNRSALGLLDLATRTSELRGREAELLANENALVRARDQAEAANRTKSAILANMTRRCARAS